MIHLNLVNQEKSDIKYKINKFPDGQQSVELIDRYKSDSIRIETRLNSFLDLEILICDTKALRSMSNKSISLYVPYFLGSRSDRKFIDGGVNYLKEVICPIINSLEFDSVEVLDPHSDVLEACLNNFVKHSNLYLVRQALTKIDNKDGAQYRVCLVSPDAGAYKKIFDVAKTFEIENIITASKVRDLKTGAILRTEVPTLDQHKDLKYIIIDDICDGGRTFIELAKVMKESRPTAKIYLVVTHGIFSGGFYELDKWFEGIFCTNSYEDIKSDTEGTSNSRGASKTKPNLVTQINIF
jgi:ribose-phosphate pyrophosphokinase